MPRYSERSIFEKLGLQYSRLECDLRELTFDYEEEVENYQLQMARIRRLEHELAQAKLQENAKGSEGKKRRGRISELLKKLSLMQVPKLPDEKSFLREKELIEHRMAYLMKKNAQLLAIHCTQRIN